MLNIGPQELILILIVALVVVGPQRLPELGRTIGKVLREFRKIQDDVKDTIKIDLNEDPEPYVRPQKSPRTRERNGEVTAVDESSPADVPDGDAPSSPDVVEGSAAGAPAEQETDPEPRAVE